MVFGCSCVKKIRAFCEIVFSLKNRGLTFDFFSKIHLNTLSLFQLEMAETGVEHNHLLFWRRFARLRTLSLVQVRVDAMLTSKNLPCSRLCLLSSGFNYFILFSCVGKWFTIGEDFGNCQSPGVIVQLRSLWNVREAFFSFSSDGRNWSKRKLKKSERDGERELC